MCRIISNLIALIAVMLALAGDVMAQPFVVSAREDRRVGGASGTLVIDADRIAFLTEKPADAREWPYAAIRVLRLDAPDQLTIETYEARGWLALNRGHKRVTYTVAQEGLQPAAVEFLLGRVARPMVTRVMPSHLGVPEWTLEARHERRGDDAAGTLELYADGLAFRGARAADTRFWRYRDLASVLPLGPFRIEVTAREANDLKPFMFQLPDELPDVFREALWTRLHASEAPAPSGAASRGLEMVGWCAGC
jgi:hypothetical protein